ERGWWRRGSSRRCCRGRSHPATSSQSLRIRGHRARRPNPVPGCRRGSASWSYPSLSPLIVLTHHRTRGHAACRTTGAPARRTIGGRPRSPGGCRVISQRTLASSVGVSKRRFIVVGSTGSVGTQALDVLSGHRHEHAIIGLAAGSQLDLLLEQALDFCVPVIGLTSPPAGGEAEIRRRLAALASARGVSDPVEVIHLGE